MSEHKTLRVSAETAAAIKEAADREGVSQSDIIRAAVEARLGVAEPEPEPDVYTLIVHAAKGELQAQRDLARLALGYAMQEVASREPDRRCIERRLIEALAFVRLAAAHGKASDQSDVLTILSLMEQHCPGAVEVGDVQDVLGRLDYLADAGVPGAGESLAGLAAELSPEHAAECLEGARHVRARLREEMEAGQ